jgi:hypothetical protein
MLKDFLCEMTAIKDLADNGVNPQDKIAKVIDTINERIDENKRALDVLDEEDFRTFTDVSDEVAKEIDAIDANDYADFLSKQTVATA